VSAGAPPIELRAWLPDGSCYEAEFGPDVTVDVVQSLKASDKTNARGWVLAYEPLVPVGSREVTITGIARIVHHAPGYLTPEQKRIKELEGYVERLEWLVRRYT